MLTLRTLRIFKAKQYSLENKLGTEGNLMTSSMKSPVTSSKRRRNAEKSARRFSIRSPKKQTTIIPIPATAPRKMRNQYVVLRIMALAAMLCVLFSTFAMWRKRALKRGQGARGNARIKHGRTRGTPSYVNVEHEITDSKNQPSIHQDGGNHDRDAVHHYVKHGSTEEETKEIGTSTHLEGDHEEHSEHDSAGGNTESVEAASKQAPTDTSHSEEEPVKFEELPDRIEWYSRDDYKDGARPLCRISKPYILSNGTILVPEWMEKYDRLLQRCGLGVHGFYTADGGLPGVERTREIDSDFALTIHLERFQEPTHVPSVFLTEHVLKASYLFDIFAGDAQPTDGVKERHCYTTATDNKCDHPRPLRTGLKPSIFVPKRIELGPESRCKQFVKMFEVAHGHGHGALHLNASTLLMKSHAGKSEGLFATRFRSVMSTDGMFRHLPVNSLKKSNFYSVKNGIDKTPREKASDSCALSVGIASASDEPVQGVPELKERIETLAKFAIPGSSIVVKQIEVTPQEPITELVKQLQDVDMYISGSGDAMNSIGFLRSSSSVFELMPFGVHPTTHSSLARAIGITYNNIRGKPKTDDFKRCIDGEIFNLRKRGKLKFTETPEWHEPLMKAWDAAVGEYALSGSTNFDILTADAPVKNYHARICAQKQKIEVGLDDTARKVVLAMKEWCGAK